MQGQESGYNLLMGTNWGIVLYSRLLWTVSQLQHLFVVLLLWLLITVSGSMNVIICV